MQQYLDSYRPPRHVPYGEQLKVRDEQVHDFTVSVLKKGDYHIPGVPMEVEVFLYKEIIRGGLQSFLNIFSVVLLILITNGGNKRSIFYNYFIITLGNW